MHVFTCMYLSIFEAASSENYQKKGPGSTSASRYRITYMARQAVKNYFDATKQPEGDSIYNI